MRLANKTKFNPIEKACADSIKSGWLGDRHFDIEKFGVICQRRGLIGKEIWSQKDLSLPLGMFAKEAKNLDDETINELLEDFAEDINVDLNLLKRHFYAIKFNYADQFLADIEAQEKERKRLEEFTEEAEAELPEFDEEEGEEERKL